MPATRQVRTNMQKHEGPRHDRQAERSRQRVLTAWLSIAIFVLSALLAVMLFSRI